MIILNMIDMVVLLDYLHLENSGQHGNNIIQGSKSHLHFKMRQVPEIPSSYWFYVENTKGSRRTLGSYYLQGVVFNKHRQWKMGVLRGYMANIKETFLEELTTFLHF